MALISGKYSQQEELIYTKQALELARKNHYNKGTAMAFDHLGVLYRNQSDYHLALNNHNLALQYISPYGICRERAIILNNIGVVYRRLDELSKAADFHLRALTIAEELGDNRSICISTNSLGNIYLSQGNMTEALKNFSKALDEEKKLNNQLGQAINLNNIGYVYAEQKDYQKAIDYFTQSLKVNELIGNEKGKAICYNSIGEIYFKLKRNNKAIEMYRKSLEINTKVGDLIYTSASFINIGEILTAEGKFGEAEKNIQHGLGLALRIGSKVQIERAYAQLSDLYLKKSMYREALEAYRISRIFRDSILNENNNTTIARLKTIYETERKEKEIQSNKLELEIRKKQLLKEKALKLFFIFGFATMILVSLLLYRNYLLKKKANLVLVNYNQDMDEKNRILTMQKEEILSQRDQIEDKNKVVNKAYDLIKNKNKSIIENIRYAFQIQNALLPPLKTIRNYLPESFIVYKPRDIVSGDFYWAAKKNNLLIAVSADCTGHGVSGAFMSILGISALNEIVNERGITRPDLILNQLRERIITSLQQEDKFWEARDGIDMAIITFDFLEGKVFFGGANSSVILIRNEELIQLKGDKMPVSIFPDIFPFTYVEYKLMPNDVFYLFTDGYYHQFGGVYGKKFNIRQFTSLLQNIHRLKPEEQQDRLEETFRKWRGRNEQVDDILVIGITITQNMLVQP
jgi:serine phosphatase RsbU (regulator of sigma subunit)/Tfp pilus assembly protein PilF